MHPRARTDRPRRGPLIVVFAVLVASMLLASSASSLAAPLEPTLGTAALQAMLATGPVPGYFATVVSGSTIETIPVTIRSILPADVSGGLSQLIFFQAHGATITAIGGIAAGMSGSPVFVNDGGTDKLVGAVSYGDSLTLGGLGLATPIDDMAAIETAYDVKATTVALRYPARTKSGLVTRVAIAPTAAEAAALSRAAGTAALSPLRVVHIGGISPSSRLFGLISAEVAKSGATLAPGLSSTGPGSDFETTLTGGAAVGALASRGDLLFGGFGTVTYATTDTVVAFGHPALFSGTSGMEMTNAWVHGIWGSSFVPYKLASAGRVRGIFTQDRGTGIAGRTDVLPQETLVTARATMGAIVATSTSYLPKWAADKADLSYLPAASSYVALGRATNASAIPGSAQTTSTYVVSDGTTTLTVVRANLFDDANDIAYAATGDLRMIASAFADINTEEIYRVHVVSVDMQASVILARRSATIVDVSVPGGLKNGTNHVRVSLLVHGVAATQTVDVPLVLPVGTNLGGQLRAESIAEDGGELSGSSSGDGPAIERRSPAQMVLDIAALPKNDQVIVTYTPGESSSSGALGFGVTAAGLPAPITTSPATSWVLTGRATKSAGEMTLSSSPSTLNYGGTTLLTGKITQVADDTTVTLFRRIAGTSVDTTIARVRVLASSSGEGSFTYLATGLTKTTRFIARWDGDVDSLGATTARTVSVKARVKLTATPSRVTVGGVVKLKAVVSPSQPRNSKVTFERKVAGVWKRIKTVALTGTTVSYNFKPPTGSHSVRARFLGSVTNLTSASNTVLVRVAR